MIRGVDIMSLTKTFAGSRKSAITFLMRSRSVTMPIAAFPCTMTAQPTPRLVIDFAHSLAVMFISAVRTLVFMISATVGSSSSISTIPNRRLNIAIGAAEFH